MIIVSEYSGKKVGVFGLGKAGDATLAALLAGGADVYAWDDRETSCARAAAAYPAAKLAAFADWPWKELKALILSPGVPLTYPKPHPSVVLAQKHECPVIGDIELLFRACPKARYIGITGTNGKSTTTALTGHILAAAGGNVQIGGNLGTAALSLKPLESDGTYVLELSSYQLDLVKTTRFTIAAMLNATPDHLDRHGSMEAYVAAKKHIFDRQEAGDVAVLAIDDDHTDGLGLELKKRKAQQVVEVSGAKETQGVYVREGVLYDVRESRRFDLNPIVTLTGRHNWQNAAVAYAIARAAGLGPDAIYQAMQSYGGLRHRLQQVATIRGVRFINDSKATNAEATANALAPYRNIYWIVGGRPKAGGIDALAQYFPRIVHAFLIGESENAFAATLEGRVPYTHCGTLKAAVKEAAALAFADRIENAVVLLSPACASFDQWKNFEARGDAFCRFVEALAIKWEVA